MTTARTRLARVRVIDSVSEVDDAVVAVYARVTQEESFATDLSIPNQKRRALEVCAERGWTCAKVYAEPRHVGGDLGPEHRPALRSLLQDIETGKVARVLVRHTDRLWRSTTLQDRLLAAFSRHSVEVWDFSHEVEYRSAHGKFSTIVLGAAAQLEKDLVAERVREMKRGKAVTGKPAGGPPPFGYTSQSRVKAELIATGVAADLAAEEACKRLPAAKRWYVDPKEAEVVRLAFDLYVKERQGCRRITEALNERGHRRRSGRLWAQQKVTRLLSDPVVAGYVTYDEEAYRARRSKKAPKSKQALFDGEHEAIIPREVWNEAQRLREANTTWLRTKSRSGVVFPLTGILKCGNCGGSMVGKASRPRGVPFAYYMCAARKYRGTKFGCASETLRADKVEATVIEDLRQILSSPSFVHEFMAKANVQLRERRPEAARLLSSLEEQQKAAARSVEKLTARYEGADDKEGEELAWGLLRQALAKRKALDAQVADARATLAAEPTPTVTLADTERYLAALRERLGERRDRMKALLDVLKVRHDLRVRALTGGRLVLAIRLDEAAVTGKESELLRNRLIVVPGGASEQRPPSHVLTRELTLPAEENAETWAQRENTAATHPCACGCGEQITILPKHRATGIPRFIHGHHRMAMTAYVERLNAEGYLTIAQAARKLGTSENTLRRHGETRFGLTMAWRQWGKRFPMRAYKAADVDAVAGTGRA